ncbi:MAG: hypothetical protein U0174_11875 [Polyangiaceae bacterium]
MHAWSELSRRRQSRAACRRPPRLRAAGLSTPVVAVGKIATQSLAEEIVDKGEGDLVGMARALLADPDLPRKWRAGREETVVRCLYGNVCKALDENFKRVDCTLWPKHMGAPPDSDDTVAPEWPESGAKLTAEATGGKILLRWHAATDNEGMYGYQLFRAEGAMPLVHYASIRAGSLRFEDTRVLSGTSYRYAVRPYDLAGNRGLMSPSVEAKLPDTLPSAP